MPKGKNFLKVTGILMIIFGGLNILSSPASCVCAAAAAELGLGILTVSVILGVVAGIIQLIVGIVGCANCSKPEKAQACVTWGIIVLVITVISFIVTLIANGQMTSAFAEAGLELPSNAFSTIISVLADLAIPVLFLIGAFKNKASAQ